METGERAPTRMQTPSGGCLLASTESFSVVHRLFLPPPSPQVCAHPPVSHVTLSVPTSQVEGSVLRSTTCQVCSCCQPPLGPFGSFSLL